MKINKSKHIPLLAITMGDPAGIGPEIAAKAFSDKTVYDICRPILIGHIPAMGKAIKVAQSNIKIHEIHDPAEARFHYGIMDLFAVEAPISDDICFGEVSALAGDLAFRSIKTAIDLALQKKVDGTVTGPINKEAINKAGHHFSGHSEIYANLTNTRKYAMLLVYNNLRIIHVSTHISLRQACDLVKTERIIEVALLLDTALKKLGIANPRIGVAGLNPHSGDGGLFGSEEINEIIPAINEMRKTGINAEGPIPADTLFAMANGGKYDGCIAMYHDQGHIPLKFHGFKWNEENKTMESVSGVNITLGLPILRTSVDHGTAFDIAGKGIASPDALMNAIEYAVKLLN
jgi:4-hydroxythreonine-4-phosphate dehydrogenase